MPLFEQLTEREKDVYSHDYGGMVHRKPKKVAQFQPDTDLKQLIEEAANDQLLVTLRGAGRGCAGQSLSKGGTLIERYQRDARLTELDGAQATAAASSNLCRLELALNEHGLSLPVVPVYLNLSLGGVLSAGGLGFHSITQGQTVEHVRSFTLMTPKGERLLVSPDSHETLFRHVLCGQGQLGVIEEATMGLVPYKPYTHFAHYTFDDLNAFLKSLSWISSWRGDATLQFVGSIGLEEPHVAMYGEDVAESSDPVCAPWLQQGGPAHAYVEKNHRLKHHYEIAFNTNEVRQKKGVLYSAYCFPYDEFCEHAHLLLSLLKGDKEASACVTRIPFYAIRKQDNAPFFPFSPRQKASPSMLFGLGINWAVPLKNEAAWRAVKKVLDASLLHCVSLGGKPYLGCWHDFNESHLNAFYPRASQSLEELKKQWDPKGIIADGQLNKKRVDDALG